MKVSAQYQFRKCKRMLILALLYISITLSSSTILKSLVPARKYSELRQELSTTSVQDDVFTMITDFVIEMEPESVGLIVDSIYLHHVYNEKFVSSLAQKVIITVLIKDSESFEDEPSEKVQSTLITMKKFNCKLYIILITNGIQMVDFLKYTDYFRLINTRAKIVMLHDYRLFAPGLHFIWKRIVNVVFIRNRDMKHRTRYELSTVPFPEKIQEIYVPRVINYWSPFNRYLWKKKNFIDRSNQHLNGVTLNAVVLQHTPTVFKGSDMKYFGLEIDLINALGDVMNFSINFFESSDAETEKWGRKVGGRNFTGLLREVDEARADIALGDLHYTTLNLDVMDLTIPYNVECLTFITPELLSDNTWKTLILPFSLGLWIGILVSLCLVGIVFFTFSNVYRFVKGRAVSAATLKDPKSTKYFARDFFDALSACLLYTYSMILLVSLPRLPLRWSVRVLTGWWWIYSVLIVVAYRASLTSILANPQPRVTIDTLEVLANSWLKCGAWGAENKEFFVSSVDSAAQKIGAKLEHVDDGEIAVSFT